MSTLGTLRDVKKRKVEDGDRFKKRPRRFQARENREKVSDATDCQLTPAVPRTQPSPGREGHDDT